MMKQASTNPGPEPKGIAHLEMETTVGYILLSGVLLSIALIVVGLIWHLLRTGELQLGYSIVGLNLFQFVLQDVRQLGSGAVRPRALVSMGIAVLMLTPYARVMVSTVHFAFIERNWKYTLFTGFVFAILTYSLFLR
jgi:uncharacterized membrane protein